MEEAIKRHFFHHGKAVHPRPSKLQRTQGSNAGSSKGTTRHHQSDADERDKCHWCQLRSFPTHQYAPVTVVNEVDSQVIPPRFRFINENVLDAGVEPAELSFRSGCTCAEDADCQYTGCLCLADLEDEADDDDEDVPPRKSYAYHTHGAKAGLLRSKLHSSKLPLYECHQGCSCTHNCPNRVVERGRTVPLQIFRTENRGWGMLAHPTDLLPTG